MPKVAELRQIDWATWARLDVDWDKGSVTLLTEAEIMEIRKAERKRIIQAIEDIDIIV